MSGKITFTEYFKRQLLLSGGNHESVRCYGLRMSLMEIGKSQRKKEPFATVRFEYHNKAGETLATLDDVTLMENDTVTLMDFSNPLKVDLYS